MADTPSDLAKEGVQSVGGFFRAFDIAFFMPGVIVLLASWWFHRQDWWQPQLKLLPSLKGGDDAAAWLAGVVFAVALVVAAFVVGLFCHAIARILSSLAALAGRGLGNRLHVHPYRWLLALLFNDRNGNAGQEAYERENSQLSLYLWNLSSLGWSLASALLLVMWMDPRHRLLWLVGALVLCLLGSDFRFWSVRLGKARHA